MISNTDLRINNLVLYRGEVSVVKGVLKTSVDLLVDPCVRFTKMALLENIQPIPLTEEWLVKIGFSCISRHSFHNYALPNNFIISMWMQDKPISGFEERGVCYWGEHFIALRFVHQVQNLYFTITGQELTITL